MTTSKIATLVRWDQALLSESDMPSDVILEGLYKSKLQDSVQLQTVLALHDQETVRNSKFQSPERSCGKKISHQSPKVKKERKPA